MLKSGKIKNIIRSGSGSLLAKLTITFVVFVILMNIVQNVNVSLSRSNALRDYFVEEVEGKMQTVWGVNHERVLDFNHYVDVMEEIYPEIATTLATDDYSTLESIVRNAVKVRNLPGFVILDSNHEVRATSYEGYTPSQEQQMQGLMSHLLLSDQKSYSGCVDLMGAGISLVSARLFADSNGRFAAMVVLCITPIEDDNYLKAQASFTQSNMSVYRDNVISATSYDKEDVDIHGLPIPQKWVADSAALYHKDITLTEVAGTSDVFSSYKPLINYDGTVLGLHHVWLSIRVQADIAQRIKASTIIVSVICTIVFILFFYLFVRRHVTKPLTALRDDAMRIASGDLSERVTMPRTHDEVEQLADAMDRMQDSLRESLGIMAKTGEVIQSSSAQIGKASARLSDISNRQASSLEEVAASLEEMSANVHMTTESSVVTDGLMSEANVAVANIADNATDSMNATRRIAGSLRAINSLVSQTNVLSLNASVEAARAGSHGRGFSVVAREVGRLAEQTRVASVDVSETSTLSIAGAENINKMIDDLVPQLQKVADSIKEITRASREQAVGLDQINSAVENLNNVTQETAADSEELAANAQELAELSVKMKEILDSFSL